MVFWHFLTSYCPPAGVDEWSFSQESIFVGCTAGCQEEVFSNEFELAYTIAVHSFAT